MSKPRRGASMAVAAPPAQPRSGLKGPIEPTPAVPSGQVPPQPMGRALRRIAMLPAWAPIAAILAIASLVRLWQIDSVGYNSDEAVYSGQAAAIADDGELNPLFPAFRAHPVLVQTMLSIGYRLGGGEIFGRVAIAVIGVATVYLVYRLAELLYGRRVGLVAALLIALMPYHVIVSRQVLLDVPMTFFATGSMYLLARFAVSGRVAWLYATGAAMGMTVLAKETGIVLLGSIYATLALSPAIRVRLADLARSLGVMALFVGIVPLSLLLAGGTSSGSGGNFIAWQLFRRANHDLAFYPIEVSQAIGLLVIAFAVVALWRALGRATWRETLLVAWIVVPLVFFELWAVKGYQYLLPIAPAVAILAARSLSSQAMWQAATASLSRLGRRVRGLLSSPPAPGSANGLAVAEAGPAAGRLQVVAIAAVGLTLLVPTLSQIDRSNADDFLAGTGGVPGGREAGRWIERNVPVGSRLMTIGPSMANILQFYGHREADGLSVSPNPLNRNPAYEPLINPDRMIREDEIQYLVWDSYSAKRSQFFADNLRTYVDRYHGRALHSEFTVVRTPDGREVRRPIITIYEVRP